MPIKEKYEIKEKYYNEEMQLQCTIEKTISD